MTWLISLGYAVFTLQDFMFALTSGMNLVGHLVLITLTLYKSYKYAEPRASYASDTGLTQPYARPTSRSFFAILRKLRAPSLSGSASVIGTPSSE